MSSFTRKLSTTQLEARLWRMDASFTYHVGDEESDYYFEVDKGFTSDGGSIPRFAWWVDAPNGDGAQAYFLHDALYRSHLVDRAEADRIMLEALEVLGLHWFRRQVIYRSVRALGWKAYNDNGKDKEQMVTTKRYVRMHVGEEE
jgi:hypothetical protein